METIFPYKDLLKLVLFTYLDGPAACALLQTCKRFNQVVTDEERLALRLRPIDMDWKLRQVRQAAWICQRCFKIFQSIDHADCDCDYIAKISNCESCGKPEVNYSRRPWMKLTVVIIKCTKCDLVVNTGKIVRKSDLKYLGCMSCGFICLMCAGRLVKCNKCDFLSTPFFVTRHEQFEHPSWTQSVWNWISYIGNEL